MPAAVLLAAALAVGCESGDGVTGASADVRTAEAPPSQSPLFGAWHRLGVAPTTPEHVVLHVRRLRDTWVARFDKRPEPTLGFETPPARDFGTFEGSEIGASDIICLGDFLFDCPGDVVVAVEGTGTFTSVDPPFEDALVVPIQLLVIDGDRLWFTWLFPEINPEAPNVSCPWFRSFEEALAANPFPLPFNGTDFPPFDCILEFL
jgi:hypothetical protein